MGAKQLTRVLPGVLTREPVAKQAWVNLLLEIGGNYQSETLMLRFVQNLPGGHAATEFTSELKIAGENSCGRSSVLIDHITSHQTKPCCKRFAA